jgi:ElaB/YqjD/DUF883 family membrane-anchored ribosome-binding protein
LPSSHRKRLVRDWHRVPNEYNERSALADEGPDNPGKTTDKINKVADQAEGLASTMSQQVHAASDHGEEVIGNVNGAVDKSLKNQPVRTLALAAVIGFVPVHSASHSILNSCALVPYFRKGARPTQ